MRKAKSRGYKSKGVRLRKWMDVALKKVICYQLIWNSELLFELGNKDVQT